MYSVRCETCSREFEADTYDEANDFFVDHASHRHEVELLNVEYASKPEATAD